MQLKSRLLSIFSFDFFAPFAIGALFANSAFFAASFFVPEIVLGRTCHSLHSETQQPQTQLEEYQIFVRRLVGSEEIMNRLINTNDDFWQSLSREIAAFNSGYGIVIHLKDFRREVQIGLRTPPKSAIEPNGVIEVRIFRIFADNLILGARHNGLELHFARMVAAIFEGLRGRGTRLSEEQHVVLVGDEILSDHLFQSLSRLGFQGEGPKYWLRKYGTQSGLAVLAAGLSLEPFIAPNGAPLIFGSSALLSTLLVGASKTVGPDLKLELKLPRPE